MLSYHNGIKLGISNKKDYLENTKNLEKNINNMLRNNQSTKKKKKNHRGNYFNRMQMKIQCLQTCKLERNKTNQKMDSVISLSHSII